ncbi:MAG: DUF523 domain-containing protein [bacterium]|nr:DUF523 domain-containing protein [bacterium]
MSVIKIKYERPKIILSRCLRGDKVRYNGEPLTNSLFVELQPHVDLLTVCPEVQMGMPVPRPPIQIHQSEKPILFQPSTGANFSDKMAKLCHQLNYSGIDGFLLKARSPSCGIIDTPHYLQPPSNKLKPGRSELGQGLFTYIMKEKYKNVVFCDEDRFAKPIFRDWFLTSCFFSALRRANIFDDWVLPDTIVIPNLSFRSSLLTLWPKKLYEFYDKLAIKLKFKSKNLPQFAKDPINQLRNIFSWRSAPSTKHFLKDFGPIIQPYPSQLSYKN